MKTQAQYTAQIKRLRGALHDLREALEECIDSYDDTGCEFCGVVDSAVMDRAIATQDRLRKVK